MILKLLGLLQQNIISATVTENSYKMNHEKLSDVQLYHLHITMSFEAQRSPIDKPPLPHR